MRTIVEALHRHRTALMLAVIISALFGIHHFLMAYWVSASGGVYAPVTEAANFDEGADYIQRARAAYRGELIVGDIALAEYAGSPAFLPMLNPLILGGLGRIMGSFSAGIIASDFIFPPIIFILVYLTAYELTRRQLAAIACATLFLILPKIGLFPSVASLPFLSGARELYFSRFEYPSVTFPFFMFAMYGIARALTRGTRASALSAGVGVGLLFYTYLYDWVSVSVGLGLLSVYFAAVRDWVRLRTIMLVGTTAALLSVGYWVNFFHLFALPSFHDVLDRLGVEVGRGVRVAIVWTTYVRALTISAIVWFLDRRGTTKRLTPSGAYLIAFLLPIIFVLNIQVITNTVPQPDHWHRTQFFILALALCVIALRLTQGAQRRCPFRAKRLVAFSGIGVLIVYGFFMQYTFSSKTFALYLVDERYALSYTWLTAHTERGSVVGSLSGTTNGEVLLYTDNKVFAPNGFHTIAPTAEIWERARLLAALHGLSVDSFDTFIGSNTFYLFVDRYRDHTFGSYFRPFKRKVPGTVQETERAAYLLAREHISTQRIPYRLDYLLVGPREDALTPSSYSLAGFPLKYDANGVRIYALK